MNEDEIAELRDELVGLVHRSGAITDATKTEALARWACHTFAGWNPDDTERGNVIDCAVDDAIEALGLDRLSVWRLIGIDEAQ